MELKTSEGANLINIQYGVAFGVIFNLCFYQDTSAPIRVAVVNFFPFLGFLIYFFIDWLTANFARDKFVFGDWIVYVWSLAIWYLGSIVILMNSEGNFKYLWASIYIVIAGLFDLFGYKNIFYKLTNGLSIVWVSLAGVKFIFGAILFLFTEFATIRKSETSLYPLAVTVITTVSIIKLLRYVIIRNINKQGANDE